MNLNVVTDIVLLNRILLQCGYVISPLGNSCSLQLFTPIGFLFYDYD